MDTEVSKEYNFSDFTVDHYRQLLQLAKKRFKFISYPQAKQTKSFVLWRHDVDFSVHRAYRLAKVEADCNIKSTYFLHPHSKYYNLLEKEITNLVHEIIGFGHDIGLHFDSHYYGIFKENELEEKISYEKNFLESLYNTSIEAFSFHNTTPFTMGCKKWEYAGLINTYASYFQDNVEYCSDSNGYWRYNRLYNVLESTNSTRLQVLTHPEWWQEQILSPWGRIQRCVNDRAKRNLKDYKSHLRKYKMKNIDWQGPIP